MFNVFSGLAVLAANDQMPTLLPLPKWGWPVAPLSTDTVLGIFSPPPSYRAVIFKLKTLERFGVQMVSNTRSLIHLIPVVAL